MKEASALDWYMDLCATAIALSLTESEDSEITHVAGHLLLDGNITPSDRQFHSLLWARLNNDNIFEIEPSLIIIINDGWTNHFQEDL